MRVNTIPLYNQNYYGTKNINNKKHRTSFAANIASQSFKQEAGIFAALAGFASIPFVLCYIAKRVFSNKSEKKHQHLFLNDGTYFINTKDIKS